MVNIYDYLDYRSLISDYAKQWKRSRQGWTYQKLAEKAQMHPPYLSNILKKRAHLNSDQLYALAEVMGISEEELHYIALLMEHERSALLTRREKLELQIKQIRKAKLKTSAHIKVKQLESNSEFITRYFMNPELRLVHLFLDIPRYAKKLSLVAESLNLSLERVEALVKELEEMGYVTIKKGKIEKQAFRVHLPKESHLYVPEQLLMQYRSLQHQQLLGEKDKYNFSVTFTADDETRDRIKRRFLNFLTEVEGLVKEAPSEAVYQFNVDLFSWSR